MFWVTQLVSCRVIEKQGSFEARCGLKIVPSQLQVLAVLYVFKGAGVYAEIP